MTFGDIDIPAVPSLGQPTAELAYIDESGNTGEVGKGGTNTYTLGCLLVPVDSWTDRLDLLIDMRREISDTYGIRRRDEIKANYLLNSRGSLKGMGLGDGQRRDIYQRHMQHARLVGSGAFGVVIVKERMKPDSDPAERAWEYLLQRLRMRSAETGRPIFVVHDEGDDARVRAQHRRFRRHSWAPARTSVQAKLLVEDPISRRSTDSYFIQMADLIAFAAFRRVMPPGANRAGSVCNERMWEKLGDLAMVEVSKTRPDGIVEWPRA